MPKDEKGAAAEAAEKEAAEAKLAEEQSEEFDKDRALSTIRAQRENEKVLKAENKRLLAIEAEVEKAKDEEAEANKDLETKVADREARITELESQLAENEVKTDFLAKAGERGYESPDIAYLAAKDAGVLGVLDPATGTVKVHDFDKLEERHPSLAGEAEGERVLGSGDAGVRGHRGKSTIGTKFNKAIRESF